MCPLGNWGRTDGFWLQRRVEIESKIPVSPSTCPLCVPCCPRQGYQAASLSFLGLMKWGNPAAGMNHPKKPGIGPFLDQWGFWRGGAAPPPCHTCNSAQRGLREILSPAPGSPNPWGEPSYPGSPQKKQVHWAAHHKSLPHQAEQLNCPQARPSHNIHPATQQPPSWAWAEASS